MLKAYFIKLLTALKNGTWILSSLILTFLQPIQNLIFLSIVLCLFDLFTKLFVVYKTEGMSSITSKKMGETGYKMIFYSVLLIVLQLVNDLFIRDHAQSILSIFFEIASIDVMMKVNIASFGAALIILRELKSIDENWESFSGWSFIKSISDKISTILKWKK